MKKKKTYLDLIRERKIDSWIRLNKTPGLPDRWVANLETPRGYSFANPSVHLRFVYGATEQELQENIVKFLSDAQIVRCTKDTCQLWGKQERYPDKCGYWKY